MSKTRRTNRSGRQGAAVVELAICLPAIVLLVMGALECCTMIFLRQSLHVTAYEGVRLAIRNDTDTATVLSRCEQVLNERSVNDSTVTTTPADTSLAPRGTQISLQVSAPCDGNNVLPLQFFGGDLSATATMIKE